MKKISIILISLALLSACMRENLFGNGGAKTIRQVTAELPENPATKAQLHEGGAMTWDANDRIGVFSDVQDVEYFSNRTKDGSASQEFFGNPVSGTEFFAFFPDDGSVTFHPDSRYQLQFNYSPTSPVIGTNPSMRIPMVARMESGAFKFKQTMGLIHFSIQGEHVIKFLRLRGNNSEALAGSGTIDLTEEKPVFVLDGTGASQELLCQPAEPYAIPADGKLDIYFPVPQMTFTQGLTLDICYLDNGEEKVLSKETQRSIVVMRAGIKNFKVVDLDQLIQERGDDGWSYTESVRGADLQTDEETVIMHPEAVFVQKDINDNLVGYNSDEGTISFKKDEALTGMDVRVGDVLYSMPVEGKAPDGYILRVTDVREEGGKMVYSVEEAGLADAFDRLETTFSYEPEDITEDCFTVWDPLDQPEVEDYLVAQQATVPGTKGFVDDVLSDISINPLDKKRYDLDIDERRATLDVILLDVDEDLKTAYDQLKIQLRIDYSFDDGVFSFDKESSHLEVGWKPAIGFSAAAIYDPEAKLQGDDLSTQKKAKEAMLVMEKKLVGKKIKLVSFDIPMPTAAKVAIKPSIDFYVFFNLTIDGKLEVRVGIKEIPFDFHIENIPYDFTTVNKNTLHLNVGRIVPFMEADIEAALSAKVGVGCGVVVKLPKPWMAVMDQRVKPFAGFFWEYSFNAKVKNTTTANTASMEITNHTEVEWYPERESYAEAYARLKGGLLFSYKHTFNKWKDPDGTHKWDTTFTLKRSVPKAYGIAPENGGIAPPPNVSFQWGVPEPMEQDVISLFSGLKYDLYLSTDKQKVEDLDPSVRVASNLEGRQYNCPIDDKTATWYWKVLTRNAIGSTYESSLYRFDTGSDGELRLDSSLAHYLRNNFGTLGEAIVTEEGVLHKTPSNLAALRSLKELTICDPEDKYGISDISALLAELPNLEVLDCRNNRIQTLSFPNNPKLTSLTCRDNQLTSINLSNVPDLVSIACSRNSGLTKLNITGCPELKVLDAEDCMLDSLDLRYHQKLQNLYLAGNNFSRLDISRCATLVRLDVYSQHQELLTLRLQKSQEDAIIKRHFNMVLDYVSLEPVLTEAAKGITSTGAVIPVTILVTNYLPLRGVVYSSIKEEPSFGDSQRFEVETQESAFEVIMENLTPDTEYYVRGFGRNPSNFETAYGNVIRFKTLPGEDAPAITVAPEEYDFKEVKIGSSAEHDFVVTNSGTADLVFTAGISDGPFSVSPGDEITLAPGGEQTLSVRFAPTEVGDTRGDITLRSNVPGDPFVFSVFGNGTATTPPDPSHSIPEMVDLGLPSGLKWASFNVGATKPEEYGHYFAWGETAPKAEYNWKTYMWCNGTSNSFSKYSGVDNKTKLELADDAALAYLGENWRLPTAEEFSELATYCSRFWTTENGVYGCKFTSTFNGNSIFLPASGYMDGSNLVDVGSIVCSWSSSLYERDESYANSFRIQSYDLNLKRAQLQRCYGVTVRAVYEEHVTPVFEAVDLGLPSGLRWASSNLGASTPEEYGDYYAWGETESKEKWGGYTWQTYKWCEGTENSITKYNTYSDYGVVDNKTVLDLDDDIAHVKLGGRWRMPTKEEFAELVANCTYESNTLTSKINGNTIFFPAAGYWHDWETPGSGEVAYWSSSSGSSAAICYTYRYGSFNSGGCYRFWGLPVRAVYCPAVTSVSLMSNMSLTIGQKKTLVATVYPDHAIKAVSWSSSNESVAAVSPAGEVTGVSSGNAVITVTTQDGGKTSTCLVTVSSKSPVPKAIDLGLPSGIKWASFNVGATAPEESGDYFAWGETKPKEEYSWGTYKWCDGAENNLTKYNSDSDSGVVDNKTVLDLEDDVAHVRWGGNWRMPTVQEFDELQKECTFLWIYQNGVGCWLVTSKTNGNSIIFPACGYRGGGALFEEGEYGSYLSSSLKTSVEAWGITGFSRTASTFLYSFPRYCGYSVRPVCEK